MITDALPATSAHSRRALLRAGFVASAVLAVPGCATTGLVGTVPVARGNPFALGVASGEPAPDGVVLWTRLATDPLAENGLGGLGQRRPDVQWELATDERFRDVVRRGTEGTGPERGHSVHVEPAGLKPGSEYFHRFRAGGEISPTGRTRTAPAGVGDDAALDVLRLLRPVRARLVHRVRPARRGRAGPGAAPGRPPLRARREQLRRPGPATCVTTPARRPRRWPTTAGATPGTSPTRTCSTRTRSPAATGAHVVVTGRDAGRGEKVVADIDEAGGRARFVRADLASGGAAVRALADAAHAVAGGPLDVLVNNAALLIAPAPTAEVEEGLIDRALAVNIKAVFLLTGLVAPGMAQRGKGAVVNVGSINGLFGMAGSALYSTTKAAVRSLTKSWADEYGPAGVRVNTVAPGPTTTARTAAFRERIAPIVARIPSRRPSTPEEVAKAVVFLASDDASSIHGATLSVDGGRVAI